MVGLLASMAVAMAGARHPCTPAADLGPDQYARKSVVVFPLQHDPESLVLAGEYDTAAPDGSTLRDIEALLVSVSTGLFAVDWPLTRLDAWHTSRAPRVDDDTWELAEDTKALRCTDTAVVPRLVAAEVDATDGGSKVKLTLGLQVYQRDNVGALSRTHDLSAAAPGIVDSVEDMMLVARRQSVDRVMQAIPVSKKKLEQAELASDVVLDLLPADQAAQLESVVQQTSLAATRVASVARPKTLLPQLEPGKAHPGALGLAWRAEEDRCYITPPKDEEPERKLACATLTRARQAVRDLQLQTRRIESFRLISPVADGDGMATPLGEAEGVGVGDGYWLRGPQGRVGYARVRRVGAGGPGGGAAPTALQVVYGPRSSEAGLTVREDPRLGIEIGGTGGVLPAKRPDATLSADPIEGGARSISAGALAAGGALRFDVNLGRTAGWYEWYQTNRIHRGFAGQLHHGAYTAGLERRWQVVPRTSVVLGAGVTVGSWSIPSGVTVLDDDGERKELRASASRIGGDLEGGLSWMAMPSILVRAMVGGRLAAPVDEFTWSDDDLEGTVRPIATDGTSFRLRTSGVAASLSTAWVF